MVRIRSGPSEVIGSGMVTAFGGQPLELTLLDGTLEYTVAFHFRSDPAIADVAVDVAQHDAGMRLELTNFDGPDGRGSAVPVLLGSRDDALYFVHFRVFRFGRTDDRTVHYTFYRALKSEVGWTEAGTDG